jgi:hypothetical protein
MPPPRGSPDNEKADERRTDEAHDGADDHRCAVLRWRVGRQGDEIQKGWKVYANADEIGRVEDVGYDELVVRGGRLIRHALHVPAEGLWLNSARADGGQAWLATWIGPGSGTRQAVMRPDDWRRRGRAACSESSRDRAGETTRPVAGLKAQATARQAR